MPAKVITSATNKGGGGKTTLQIVLAAEAARAGKRVLLVDLDRNRTLTTLFGLHVGPTEGAGFRLVKDLPLAEAVVALSPAGHRVDLLPMGVGFRNQYLERALDNEVEMSGLSRKDLDGIERLRASRLAGHLRPLLARYDYVFLDIQNDDGDLALNGLFASDAVLVPTTPDPRDVELAMTGLRHVHQMQRDHRPALALAGVVLNRVDRAFLAREERQARAALDPSLRPFLFGASIRRASAVLSQSFHERVPPNLHPRGSASSARDGSSFASDARAVFAEFEARLARLAAPDLRDAFRAFAKEAEARRWQNLVATAPAPGAVAAAAPLAGGTA